MTMPEITPTTPGGHRLLALIEQHPNATLRELGGMVGGISAERVRQILQRMGHPPLQGKRRPKYPNVHGQCLQCNQPIVSRWNVVRLYCSTACFGEARRFHSVILTCAHCGIQYSRSHHRENMRAWAVRAGKVRSARRFCTQVCANRFNQAERKKQRLSKSEEEAS